MDQSIHPVTLRLKFGPHSAVISRLLPYREKAGGEQGQAINLLQRALGLPEPVPPIILSQEELDRRLEQAAELGAVRALQRLGVKASG